MADLSSLDVPTLQNMLNGASTYDERAAIRKAIRELRANSAPSTAPAKSSGGSYYRSGGGRPTGTSAANTKAGQYQFVGSASTTGTAKGTKQPAKVTTGRKEDNKVTSAYLSQSALRSHTDNEKKRESTGKGTAFSVGLKHQDGAKGQRNESNDEILSPTQQVSSSKIEEAVTVVTKEVEEHNPAEESVDEVQTNSQDEFEELKNVPQQADAVHDEGAGERHVEREERSEVEVDMVVTHRSAVTDFSAGNSSAAEPELESDASSTISQVETSDRKVAESSVDSEPSAQSSACEFEEDEEEEAIERQIQATLSYTERKELRARLRQLRKNRKERGPRVSDSSVSSHSRPAPVELVREASQVSVEAEQHAHSQNHTNEPVQAAAAAAPSESAPGPEPSGQAAVSIEEVDSGCCLLVENNVDGELSPAAKSAPLSPCEQQRKDLASPAVAEQEDGTYDDTSSQASSTMSDSSEKRFSGKVSSGDEVSRPKDAISAAMGQSEGVSDFRTVLRRGASPAPPSKTGGGDGAAGGEQKDFRTVLKKTDAPAPVVAGKVKADKPKAEQKDFRGQLRKSVKTKDRSSAAPRRDVPAEQADFRTVLKKGEREAPADKKATDSTDSSSSTSSTPRVKKATVPPPAKKAASPPPSAKKAAVPPPTAKKSASPPPLAEQPLVEDEVDGVSSSRMTAAAVETEQIELPAVTSEAEPAVSMERTEAEPSKAEPSKAERDLLNMDPLDPSLSYDERREIRKLQRAARLRGEKTGGGSPLSSPAKSSGGDAGQSYQEQRRLREEAKKQEDLIRRKQRQQFAAQLNASSPQTSPNHVIVRNSGAQQLLEWCRRRTVHYENIEIKDFRMSWKNGLAFAALMSSLCPGDIPYDELSAETAERNFQLAFDASENAGLQPMLDVEDMMICRIPDEKSIMTYVSSIYKHFT